MWKNILIALIALLPVVERPAHHRILFVGNSLTISHPNAALGWDAHNGMAASRPDKDYVHQVQLMLAARQGIVPEIAIVSADIHHFIAGRMTGRTLFDDVPAADWKPDLVVVQMGDNAPPETPYEVWADAYQEIRSWSPGARYIAVGKWGGRLGNVEEEYIQRAAAITGMQYVRIRDLHTEGNVAAQFADKNVAWHPNDQGMQLIAERIVEALRPSWWLPWVSSGDVGGTIPGTIPQ